MCERQPDNGFWSVFGLATSAHILIRWIRDWTDKTWNRPFYKTLEDGSEQTKDDIGHLGEDLAERFLRTEEHMKTLRRNFQAPKGGEVDIVCRYDDTLVFIEVKTRTSTAFGRPLEAVTEDKQRLIVRGAIEWLRLLRYSDILFRFDIMEVLLIPGELPELTRIENAFQLPEPIYYPNDSSRGLEDCQRN